MNFTGVVTGIDWWILRYFKTPSPPPKNEICTLKSKEKDNIYSNTIEHKRNNTEIFSF